MKQNRKFDTIIIGAGPAGLMAARELEEKQKDYLILEAKSKVGYPLRCGEITRIETFTKLFGRLDFPFIKNKISKISFRIKDTHKIVKKKMVMLDKPQFLQWLAEPIIENIRSETTVTEIKKEKFWKIQTNKGTRYAKLLILANGTNYRFQKELGLVKKTIELVPCLGGIFKISILNPETAYFFFDEDKYFASWIFPKSGLICNAGAGVILKNKTTNGLHLKNEFKQFMQKLDISLEGDLHFGGNYVTSGPIQRTYSDHLLVCGDAAGQTFAAIGEGIYFSLMAGKIAGQTAVKAIEKGRFDAKYLKKYELNWKKEFGHQMEAGIIFAAYLFFLMRIHLTKYALKVVKEDEILDTWFNGRVSFRFRLLYYLIKLLSGAPRR
jgi:digeranylgeranylglycerophospholipid reductase